MCLRWCQSELKQVRGSHSEFCLSYVQDPAQFRQFVRSHVLVIGFGFRFGVEDCIAIGLGSTGCCVGLFFFFSVVGSHLDRWRVQSRGRRRFGAMASRRLQGLSAPHHLVILVHGATVLTDSCVYDRV